MDSPARLFAQVRTARQASREWKHHQGGCRQSENNIEDGVVGPSHPFNSTAGALFPKTSVALVELHLTISVVTSTERPTLSPQGQYPRGSCRWARERRKPRESRILRGFFM